MFKSPIVSVFLALAGVVALWAAALAAGQGAQTIVFEKIKMQPVTFPHHFHQERLDNNCNLCHDMFPKQKGVIRELINQQKLKHQQVMNGKCISCHKTTAAAGKPSGPTKCTECHRQTH